LAAQQAVTDAFTTYPADTTVPCYLKGTRLATAEGEANVEDLRPGDLIRTHSGRMRPVRWIGQRTYSGQAISGNYDILPIQISAGALADGLPRRDLWVSPDHALFIDGVLVPARYLVNGGSIKQLVAIDHVAYFHVELYSHDILLAEGAPAESYLDTGNRTRFANGAAWLADHAEAPQDWNAACAELVLTGPRLIAIKRRLFERGAKPRTIQPTLLVKTDGAVAGLTLEPESQNNGVWTFALPPAEASGEIHIRLLSDPFIPACCVADSIDQRRLGIRLSAIEIDGDDQSLNTAVFRDGFYPSEMTGEGLCRWTNGHATLALTAGARHLALRTLDL
jgi:hypothetical protein